MSHWDGESDKENGLTEMEQMQLDQILLDTAFDNSYLVLTGQVTFTELIAAKFDIGHEAVMAYDPDDGPTKEQLENMIFHYVDVEAYERCAKIKSIMNETYPDTINNDN
tara:strand:+ start:9600 stop:9926 length:327 start_codon:yes stop_codon:yes gene_type:complete